MSERKSAEIKFRCTPSFKAEAQVDAAAVGESLTVYVERAVQERRFRAGVAKARLALAAGPEATTAFLLNGETPEPAEELLDEDGAEVVAESWADEDDSVRQVTAEELKAAGHPNPKLGEGLSKLGFETRPGHGYVPPDGEDVGCKCRPWEFCTHKART